MKIRQVKKAIGRFWEEHKKSRYKEYALSMSGRIASMSICLEQLIEDPDVRVCDVFAFHFKANIRMKYKTLKTAFIKDMIKEGYDEINTIKIKKI